MIRLILTVGYIFLFLVLGLPVLAFEFFLSKINKKVASISSLHIVQWAFRTVLSICGTEVIVKGEEHVLKDQPLLYIGNHRSFFDVVIGYSRCPARTGFISKNTIQKVPILNLWMERLYCLFLDRSDARDGLRVILSAIDYIKQGISIFVFPEGTRTKTGEMAPFKEGTFKIAKKTHCPIIPVAFSNTEDILEAHFPFIKAATVVVHYGEPIFVDQLDPEDQKHLGAYVQKKIEEMLEEDKDLY